MFENKQDTTILRDSLISSAKYLQGTKESKESCDSSDEEIAIQTIVSTVSSLTNNLYDVNSFLELFKNQQNLNRRFHAVVFINLLKSQNITCSEASIFYQSVLYDLPHLDWSFYLKLNFECNWSEYFVECAQQLKPNTLSCILEKLLKVQCEEELKYYLYHLVFQTLIWKIFLMHFPSLSSTDHQCFFHYNFCIPEMSAEDCNEIEEYKMKKCDNDPLSSLLDFITKQLAEEFEQNLNVHFLKVIFHGYKTLFRLIMSASGDNEPCLKKLEKLTPIFVHFLSQETTKTLICSCITESNACTVGSSYQIMSWDINVMYLVFVLQNCWRDMTGKFLHLEIKKMPIVIANYRNNFHSYLKENNLSYKILIELNEKCLKNSRETEKKYFHLLTNTIKFHYPYASRAAEYLLSNSGIWDQYDVLNLLDEKTLLLNSYEIYTFLIDAVPKADSAEKREKLLKVFFTILSETTPEIYNHAIEYIFKKYGYCDYFLSANFNSSFIQFSRKTMSSEIEKFILPLFVQSPYAVLESLIEQVMMQGLDGMEALQVLKIVPVVCLYQNKAEDVPSLIAILSPYFQKSLEMHNTKNFFNLVKTLMEIQSKEDIISFDLFLEICVIPNASTHDLNKLEITLECLNVALDVLIHEHAFEISSEKYIILIKHVGKILGFCVKNGIGELKETAFNLFELISKYKKRPDLESIFYDNKVNTEKNCFTDDEEIILMYILGIFSKATTDQFKEIELLKWKNNVIEKKCEYLWIWCAVTNDLELFADKISLYDLSYINLLKTVTPLLWHFTKTEWLHSTKLIMYYLGLLNTKAPNYPWLLPENDPEVYGVIRCLLDCFSLMMQDESMNILFRSSCLTTSIVTLTSKTTVPSSLLLNIFLDVCYLSSHVKSEIFYVFLSLLINIKKRFFAVSDKLQQKDGSTLMRLGLQFLPDSEEKSSLEDKITVTE